MTTLLDEATLAAWPARDGADLHGWRLQAETGATGRANAAWPLRWTGEAGLDQALAEAQGWYAARGLPLMLKLNEHEAAPHDLAQALAARGFLPKKPTWVMTAPPLQSDGEEVVSLSASPSAAFWEIMAADGAPADDLAERRAIIARAPGPKAFALAQRERQPAAIGMTVIAPGGLAAVFAMRTMPSARRQGLAQVILNALSAFATQNAAHTLFLQVEAANAPAIALYEKAGFAKAYSYQFWKRP
jgi:N-acetylglutamate synthase